MALYHLKSMTAYGRGISSFSEGVFVVEIQSINRRHLEISLNLPKQLMRFDMGLRKKIGAVIARGALTVSVVWRVGSAKKISVSPNMALASALKKGWEQLCGQLELDEPFPLALFAQEKELFFVDEEVDEEESLNVALHEALDGALSSLLQMKKAEGELLAQDIAKRLSFIKDKAVALEALAGNGAEKVRQKLMQRLEELLAGRAENEERIVREVALFAERADITEELVRLKGHVGHFEQMMQKPLEQEVEARGKSLDFLVQEMHREINTVGSKSGDLAVAQLVVAVKAELEKIREQVQNVE